MSTATEIHPVIAQAKQTTDMCKGRLLKTISFVPADKLTWSPAPTSKSALQVLAHCAVSNGFFCGIISRTPMPDMPFSEMIEMGRRAEAEVDTLEKATALLEESCAQVHAALDALTPEDIESMVETPIMTMPMSFFMFLPARHMDNHAAQVDYIQTTWGDMDWHF